MKPAQQRVVFNGKFFAASPTGVHRVAEELVHAVDKLLATDPVLAKRFRFEALLPPDTRRLPLLQCIGVRVCGHFTRRLWEQFDLPRHASGALVVSLCNLGPVATRTAITMIHDAQVHSTPDSYGWAFRVWYKLVQPVIGRRHRLVLTVSDFSRGELARFHVAPRERIRVVHNGIDHMDRIRASSAAPSRHGLSSGGYVLALATLQSHKNIAVLLKAFARRQRRDGLVLALFGDATRRQFEAAGHEVGEDVRFLGRIDDEDMKGLLLHAHCLAFPSLTEGFGLPPLEAMRVGCPVVVARCGALPEVCGDAALYADPFDVESWQAAFDALGTADGRRAELIAAGTKNAAGFTWERAGRALLSSLESVVDV